MQCGFEGAIIAVAADREERAIWKPEQAGYAVTVQADQGSMVENATGDTIATPTFLDELRALSDPLYKLVWLGSKKVTTA